jgi:hypothetical protein
MQDRRSFLKLFSGATAVVAGVATVGVLPLQAARSRRRPTFPGVAGARPGSVFFDVRDHLLYDRIRFPQGMVLPDSWQFFCQPIGYCQPGTFNQRTFADTNLYRANALPPPSSMLVERILLMFDPGSSDEDVAAAVKRFYFEFRLSDKVIARGPVALSASVGSTDWLTTGRGARRPVSLVESECCIHITPAYIHALEQFSFEVRQGETDTVHVLQKELAFTACLDGQYLFANQ